MSQKTVSMTFFTDAASRTFSLLESQWVSSPATVFSIRIRCGKPMFSPFSNICLTKTMLLNTYHTFFGKFYIVCTIQSPKILITDFGSSLEHSLWFAVILNSLKTNISVRLKYLLLFKTIQNLNLWRKFWKKKSFCFFPKTASPYTNLRSYLLNLA